MFKFQSVQTQKYILLTRKVVDTKIENDFNKNTLSNSALSSTNKHMGRLRSNQKKHRSSKTVSLSLTSTEVFCQSKSKKQLSHAKMFITEFTSLQKFSTDLYRIAYHYGF